MTDSETEISKPRGRPFEKGQSGNPAGKPRGTRNRFTRMAEELFDGEGEALVKKTVNMALDGNMAAMRLVMERLLPPCRERPLQFHLPLLESLADAPAAIKCIHSGLADGEPTESEAKVVIGLVEAFVKVHSLIDIDRRLRALEDQMAEKASSNEVLGPTILAGLP